MNGHSIRQPFRLATSLFFALLLLLPACGGGGSSAPDPDPDPDPYAPTVLNVFPKDLSARTGSTIRFIAELDKPASSFLWDFGGGAIPTTTTTATEFQPLVILDAPGTYTATLTVCAAECADPFQFTYTVTPDEGPVAGPHILSVAPTGSVGARGTDVTFSAQLEGDADQWDWDFGTGIEQPLQTAASPTVRLYRTGIHQGSVTVRLSGGTEDRFDFAYEVSAGMVEEPPIIDSISTSAASICDNKSLIASASLISDFPVTFSWRLNGGATPSLSTNSVARFTTELPKGRFGGELIASNAFGASAPRTFTFRVEDCPEVAYERVQPFPRGLMRIKVTGNMTAAQTEIVPPSKMDSDSLVITGWGEPSLFDIAAAPDGLVSGTLQGRGGIAWAWGDKLPINETTEMPGPPLAWHQSSFANIPFNQSHRHPTQIRVIGDRPTLAFIDPATDELIFLSGLVAIPGSAADWTQHAVRQLPSASAPFWLSEASGRPVLLMQDDQTTVLCRTDATLPGTAADWIPIELASETGSMESIRLEAYEDGSLFVVTSRLFSGEFRLFQSSNSAPLSLADFSMSTPTNVGDSPKLMEMAMWQDAPILLFRSHFPHESSDILLLGVAKGRSWPEAGTLWVYTAPVWDARRYISQGATLLQGGSRLWVFLNDAGHGNSGSRASSTTVAFPRNVDWGDYRTFNGVSFPSSRRTMQGQSDSRFGTVMGIGSNIFLLRAMIEDPVDSTDLLAYRIGLPGFESWALSSAEIVDGRIWLVRSSPRFSEKGEVWTTAVPW